jgi:glucosyl-3-phosphoglycerate phosphatase
MLSARIVLVRHGQSTWNAEGRLQGQADPPLSELGRREAAALAPVLRGFAAERVLTSDLRRARETAAELGHPEAAPDPVWREIDVGEWAGRMLADLPAGPDPSWRGGDLLPPGGERWEELEARVADAVDGLVARGGEWLVVTHGGVIRAAVAYVTGADAQRIAGPGNASVTVVEPERLLAFGWTPNGAVPGLSAP